MSITVPNVALDGETYDVYPDDIRPLSPISPTAKRVRAEMGLDTLKIPDTAEEEADHDEVRSLSPSRGDLLMLRLLINGEAPSTATSFLDLSVHLKATLDAAASDTPSKPVYGLLSEEGGLAVYNDKLKQEALRRKGSGKARVYE